MGYFNLVLSLKNHLNELFLLIEAPKLEKPSWTFLSWTASKARTKGDLDRML